MAKVELNEETGMFESVPISQEPIEGIPEEMLPEGFYEDDQNALLDESEDLLHDVEPDPLEDTPPGALDQEVISDFYSPVPFSVVDSDAVFTPSAWQVNLAESRQLGEHYLMYAVREYSGSRNYWHYYLVLGSGIEYDSDIYTYTDADFYSYYNNNDTVYYDKSVSSGSVDGSAQLVYSDLYFDYVGIDPAVNAMPYVFFGLFMVFLVLFLMRGKGNV